MPVASRILVGPRSDRWLALFTAYLGALRGIGVDVGMMAEVKAALRFIRRVDAPVIVDAGANLGEWTRLIRPALGNRAIFYLFEPAPRCVECLGREPMVGARVLPVGLGERSENLPLYTAAPADKSASLHARRDSFFGSLDYEPQFVEVTTLDDFVDKEGIEMIDFLKLDIEGHELFALRGARRALSRGRVRALALEFGMSNLNSRTFFKDLWDLLRADGYLLYRLTPGGTLLPINHYTEELEVFFRWTTWFAALEAPR
jgi:FkbM family methyltransferase